MTLSVDNPGGPPKDEPVSRITWLTRGHGGTLHSGYADRENLVTVLCPTCRQLQVFRASMYRSPSHVRGASMYRIPGLDYRFSHKDGIAIMVKEGVIVGRLLWATPACPCIDLVSVKLEMPVLPAPNPRPYS